MFVITAPGTEPLLIEKISNVHRIVTDAINRMVDNHRKSVE